MAPYNPPEGDMRERKEKKRKNSFSEKRLSCVQPNYALCIMNYELK